MEISSGPDSWWIIGLHLINNMDLVWGTEIVWTYGPLGYLIFPINVDNEIWKQTFFYGIISHSLFFLTLYFFVLKTNNPIRNAFVLGFFSIYFLLLGFAYFPWIGILLGFYLYLEYAKNKFFLIPLAFSAAFLTFTKIDLGVGSTSILVLSSVYLALKGRKKESLLCIVLYASFLIIIWQVVTNSLDSLPNFITNSLDLATGFSSVMSLDNMPFFFLLMSLPTLILFVLWIFNKNQNNIQILKFLFISSITIFFFFKEGYMRFDSGHVLMFFLLVAMFFLILTMINKGKMKKILLYSTYGLIIVYSFTSFYLLNEMLVYRTTESPNVSDTLIGASKLVGIVYSPPNLTFAYLQFENLVNDEQLEKIRAEQKQNLKNRFPLLSQRTLELLGNQTVDIIPYDIGLIYAYDLNYQPRPLMATVSYTANTDIINSKHFASHFSPDYILYEKKALDHHYPLYDEPATFRTLLCNYHPVNIDGNIVVLEKNQKNICISEEIISEQTVNFEQQVIVPTNAEGYLFAKINIQQNFLGKIFNALYKLPQIFIHINEDKIYRFVYPTSQNGILLYYDSKSKEECTIIDRVDSLLISTKYHEFYHETTPYSNIGPVNLFDPINLFEQKIKIQFLEMKINKTSPQMSIMC